MKLVFVFVAYAIVLPGTVYSLGLLHMSIGIVTLRQALLDQSICFCLFTDTSAYIFICLIGLQGSSYKNIGLYTSAARNMMKVIPPGIL